MVSSDPKKIILVKTLHSRASHSSLAFYGDDCVLMIDEPAKRSPVVLLESGRVRLQGWSRARGRVLDC